MAGPGAEEHVDIDVTKSRLGWNPQHRFQHLPVELL
jgi:hypothetical protein